MFQGSWRLMEKGRPPSPALDTVRKHGGGLSRVGRTVFGVVVCLTLVGLAAWTVALYSVKLLTLQDRLDKLESQCRHNEQNVQKYIDEQIDTLLKQVGMLLFSRNPPPSPKEACMGLSPS